VQLIGFFGTSWNTREVVLNLDLQDERGCEGKIPTANIATFGRGTKGIVALIIVYFLSSLI
jgi:hypothetical protein